jgi:Ankyrin repeats (3 copies)
MSPKLCACLLFVFLATPLAAKDSASGTLTFEGKTSTLKEVYATSQLDEQGEEYLVLLVADRVVAEAERNPAALAALAEAGKVVALRYAWKTATDWSTITPYLAADPKSGRRVNERPTIELDAFDGKTVAGRVHSKKLGQNLHFSVRFEAAILPGGALELEAGDVEAGLSVAAAGDDPGALKRALGGHGYEANLEGLERAVKDGNPEAVELFARLKVSPNQNDALGTPLIVVAASFCAHDPKEVRTPVIKALLKAGAKPNAVDGNDSTPLIWAAQSCDLEAVQALIAAGANVNAKAKGGATPLMMATVMSRDDIVAVLKKAGAK